MATALQRVTPNTRYTTTFLAILRRDITVTLREFPAFLAQVILQPLGLLFIFGRVLADLGFTRPGYAAQLFPGIVALTLVTTALQGVALPLVIEFSFTKEIEDRLLAPMPIWLVAVEKVVFAALRALVAAAMMFPVGVLVLGTIPFVSGTIGWLLVFSLLGALTGGAMGMTLGTVVTPQKINLVFAIVLTPLLFTGCTQYPWPSLDRLRWFQALTLLNPMTYVSEGVRAALIPDGPHMSTWVALVLLCGSLVIFLWLGVRGFVRRAVD